MVQGSILRVIGFTLTVHNAVLTLDVRKRFEHVFAWGLTLARETQTIHLFNLIFRRWVQLISQNKPISISHLQSARDFRFNWRLKSHLLLNIFPVYLFEKRMFLQFIDGHPLGRVFVQYAVKKSLEVITEVIPHSNLAPGEYCLHATQLLGLCLEGWLAHHHFVEAAAKTPDVESLIIASAWVERFWRHVLSRPDHCEGFAKILNLTNLREVRSFFNRLAYAKVSQFCIALPID